MSPDEAVARGAATYANYLLASKGDSGHRPNFDVTNVNAHSLGIEGIDPETQRRRNRILIPRNSPLPAKKTAECVTKMANQGTVVVQVLEGESFEPRECSPIGRTVIRGLPPNLPKGWPVEVCYEYGVNGRLHVRAKVRGTNSETELELERDESLTNERVNRWKRVLASGGGLDAFDMTIQNELKQLKGQAPQPAGGVPGVPATPRPGAQAGPNPVPSSPAAPNPAGAAAQVTGNALRPIPAPVPQPIPLPASPGAGQAPAVPTTQAVPRLIKPGNVPPNQGVARPQALAPAPRSPQAPDNVAFTCPHCRGVFQVSSGLSGKQTNCPGCHGALIVPQPPVS